MRPSVIYRKTLFFLFLLLTACLGQPRLGRRTSTPPPTPSPTVTPIPRLPTVNPTEPAPTPVPASSQALWIDVSVPEGLQERLQVAEPVRKARTANEATLHLGVVHAGEGTATWVYTLVTPFPTTMDGIQIADLRSTWQGKTNEVFGGKPLLMAASTLAAIESLWGAAAPGAVLVVEREQLLDSAWGTRPSWALIPFEELGPRWKVIRVDGVSPLDRDFDLSAYPLTVRFGLREHADPGLVVLPEGNRDPHKLTTLVMTGVTALVRAIGAKMEKMGMDYPGEDIKAWLRDADFTHVSNEVSFALTCPPANANQYSLMFCSKPEYLDLLEYVGVDIIELTGNHLMDFRVDSLPYTLDLYRQHHMSFYGGGENLIEARQPLKIEHNGNKIALLGCNPAGPPLDWATEVRPGTADCEDYGWIKEEIQLLKKEGYLPVVTLQYSEVYVMKPTEWQQRDFRALSEAGAVIISGSQAHFPQGFAFDEDHLIHYGLGNLFFDQMFMPEDKGTPVFAPDLPLPGTRLEFIDRHFFYDNHYVGTELLTAILEDYSRPRPMTEKERQVFLREAFRASGW